ncbi:unnamed protein product [Protopolystoma xenopodis]|uniref:Uncharacterized protein n=1 Tax=Protopolystoma xenopodis TaxID=117903 RepID=A0A3S5AVS4_9PLAT|nr:unnamed protein product [Protopolystoma xenopodis]
MPKGLNRDSPFLPKMLGLDPKYVIVGANARVFLCKKVIHQAELNLLTQDNIYQRADQ